MSKLIGPMPRHTQVQNFLPDQLHDDLLDWIVSNVGEFGAATVSYGHADSEDRVNPGRRIALTASGLGPFESLLRTHLLDAAGHLSAATGTPLDPEYLELELAAHGDGAFFAPHVDIATGRKRAPAAEGPGQDRVLSAVYYLHRQPRGFSGGALRLFRFGADPGGAGQEQDHHIDIDPADNSLAAFPSSVLHEVRPVRCPSGRFEDYRFALNCWYCVDLQRR